MKKMKCSDMGGPCDVEIMASTADEMIKKGMEHLDANHTEMAEKVKNNTEEENATWNKEFMQKWEATPDMVEEELVEESTATKE